MDKEPLVRVVRGTLTDVELAALVAVVATRSTSVDALPPRPAVSAWARSARPSTRPASWRHSAHPR
ncbi:acyl-CoA carboxylase subunit epsilon [Paractinoplanes rishiriensis]|uniref:acyl-CoA carboxylase subunit epsilon n=1 Tax=Paractinoplanes rishiriensis TaxID=1050105 RepID=UPI001943AB8D|nr:acyl-CoA carboxylase subunit epsilon [Actinoplanes rishiriensis]